MNGRKVMWCEKAGVKKCLEIVLAIMIISLAMLWIPVKALGASDGAPAVNGADREKTQAAATELEGNTQAVAEQDASASAEGDTPASVEDTPYTEEVAMSETAYRTKPLQDRLAQMSAEAVEGHVSRYDDMKTHWSRQVVGKLTGLDIIAGYDGRFWPADPVQGDQFVKMAILAMGHRIEQGAGYWAQPYIDAALSEGLLEEGELLDYKKPLSREQMVRIIVRAALKIDKKPDSLYDPYIIGKISDYEEISDDLKQFVIDGYKLGLVQGSDGSFHPKDTLTRAEAATVIIRILDMTERRPMAPGEDEMISLLDSRGNPTIVYPGSVKELFTVAKATEAAIPKAKGFVNFFIGADGKYIGANMYRDKASYERSIFGKTASFAIAYNVEDTTYVYDLVVWDDELYEELFPDFIREVFKTVFEGDAQKAIRLHDQYMGQRYTRTDGLNDYTTTRLNDRKTSFIRQDDIGFTIQIKLKGLK